MKRILTLCLPVLISGIAAIETTAQNPILPLWEHIPDGEPYVFEDPDKPGEYRVYLYGSHDSLKDEYCGLEQVVWSASVNDLSNWRYDGKIFESIYDRDGRLLDEEGKGDLLYAPDVTERIEDGRKVYYLYPNNLAGGRSGMVARSYRPDGPFEVCNWSKECPWKTDGVLGFDPGVFVDDDGRVYGYWGFEDSYAAELDPETMATVKPSTEIIKHLIPNRNADSVFRFFEASSMRKIEDKYVLVYSRWSADGDFGLPPTNYTLAYAYSDNPLGPFTYGGTLIDGRARGTDEEGRVIPTAYPYGNTHGSLCEINGEWWIFYHRQTGVNEYARQAMVAPVEVKVENGKGGKVYITEGEYNSEGFATDGLNPFNLTPAGIACYMTSPGEIRHEYPGIHFPGSYIKATYLDIDSYDGPFNLKTSHSPIINNTSGSVVGYKYFNMNEARKCDNLTLALTLVPYGIEGEIIVMTDSPFESKGGKVIGRLALKEGAAAEMTEADIDIDLTGTGKGKHALFFLFDSPVKGKSLCDLHYLQFRKSCASDAAQEKH